MDFGTMILSGLIGFVVALFFCMTFLQVSTVRTEKIIDPGYEILIDKGVSDTTYIYKF